MSFQVVLTQLNRPHSAGEDIGIVEQYGDVNITRVMNDTNTAQVTISQYDALVTDLQPYQFALKIYYQPPGAPFPEVVFWAPATIEDSYSDGTCLISASDMGWLEHHYVRIGDEILTITDADTGLTDTGYISADYFGIDGLLKCSYNTPLQYDADWPNPGITVGPDFTTTGTQNIGVDRGLEVLQGMKDLTTAIVGIDWIMVPLDGGTFVPGAGHTYGQVTCYDQIVRNKTDFVFSYGTGDDNLNSVSVTPMVPVTVAHVLDQPPLHRQTDVNDEAAAVMGAWVKWDAVGIFVRPADVEAGIDRLQLIANAEVTNFGFPVLEVSLEMRPDTGQEVFFTPDSESVETGRFAVGDVVTVNAVRGNRSVSGTYQITQVDLTTSGWRDPVTTHLTVTPWIGGFPG